ncbi:MAG: pantoate--beta-alanine ligase [Candidatus Aminicenantes bacterium]|nr:pantoate--beta-alanine ligase [Candidatus Aminicenantes bacterium]
MKMITSIQEMMRESERLREEKKKIGFVPTMGFLHDGHLSLVERSVHHTDVTVVSVFVNPAQFAPHEDFKEYPRDIQKDKRLLEKMGVDILFCPDQEEMYPEDYKTFVEVHGFQEKLCGRSRPIFFRGVCTVVLKLFNIIRPDTAFFGQKDAQQAVIIQKMVKDVNFPVHIEVLPIVREKDGLAKSSRNAYLNSRERKAALVLFLSLKAAERCLKNGEKNSSIILAEIKRILDSEPLAEVEYVEVVDPRNLEPLKRIKDRALIALAVKVGKTRLIDNLTIGV